MPIPTAMQQQGQNRKPARTETRLYLSLGFSAALAILMLAMPGIFGLDHNFLLRSAGWNGQTYGMALLIGRHHRTFEASRPLWDEEADSLRGRDISHYRRTLIPSRRFGAFYQLLGEDYYTKLVGYRELNREVATGKDFDTLLPALALWITGDEIGYPPMFSELQHGHSLSVGLNEDDLKFKFNILYRTVAEGGFIYEVTSVPTP